MARYVLYAVYPFMEKFSGTWSDSPIIWKYKPGTNEWVRDDANIDVFVGYNEFQLDTGFYNPHHLAEGPIRLGDHTVFPAYTSWRLASSGSRTEGYPDFNYSGGVAEIVEGLELITPSSYTGAALHSVAEDPDNPGEYYVSGPNYIAHWDGSSGNLTNFDPSDLSYNWDGFRARNLTGTEPNFVGDMELDQAWSPVYPYIGGITAGYIFQLGGYFWVVPIPPSTLRISGVKRITAQVVYALENSGDVPTDTSTVGTGSLRKTFVPINTALLGNDIYAMARYEWQRPIFWEGGVVLNMCKQSFITWTSGPTTISDMNFAWYLDSSGDFWPMDLDMTLAGGDVKACGFGCYQHPETGKIFGFFASGITQPFNSSGIRQVHMHVMELTAYNIGTHSFTWTEVADVIPPTSTDLIDYMSITSNATHLFILFSADERIYRVKLSDFSVDHWHDPDLDLDYVTFIKVPIDSVGHTFPSVIG